MILNFAFWKDGSNLGAYEFLSANCAYASTFSQCKTCVDNSITASDISIKGGSNLMMILPYMITQLPTLYSINKPGTTTWSGTTSQAYYLVYNPAPISGYGGDFKIYKNSSDAVIAYGSLLYDNSPVPYESYIEMYLTVLSYE